MKLKIITICVVIAAALALSGKALALNTDTNGAEAQQNAALHQCVADVLAMGVCPSGKTFNDCRKIITQSCMNTLAVRPATDVRAFCDLYDARWCKLNFDGALVRGLAVNLYNDAATDKAMSQVVIRTSALVDGSLVVTDSVGIYALADNSIDGAVITKNGVFFGNLADQTWVDLNKAELGRLLEDLGATVVFDPDNGEIDFLETAKATYLGGNLDVFLSNILLLGSMGPEMVLDGVNTTAPFFYKMADNVLTPLGFEDAILKIVLPFFKAIVFPEKEEEPPRPQQYCICVSEPGNMYYGQGPHGFDAWACDINYVPRDNPDTEYLTEMKNGMEFCDAPPPEPCQIAECQDLNNGGICIDACVSCVNSGLGYDWQPDNDPMGMCYIPPPLCPDECKDEFGNCIKACRTCIEKCAGEWDPVLQKCSIDCTTPPANCTCDGGVTLIPCPAEICQQPPCYPCDDPATAYIELCPDKCGGAACEFCNINCYDIYGMIVMCENYDPCAAKQDIMCKVEGTPKGCDTSACPQCPKCSTTIP